MLRELVSLERGKQLDAMGPKSGDVWEIPATSLSPTHPGYLQLTPDQVSRLICHEPITQYYDVEDEPFARGKFATVRRVVHKSTGRHYAAKFVRKRRRSNDQKPEIIHEVAVLELATSCQHIVRLQQVFETSNEMILILQLAPGGELQTILDSEEGMAEEHVVKFMRQILQGLNHLHAMTIAHLDLKPQNLVLTGEFPNCDVLLCDFGISRYIAKGADVRELLGTPDYVAPEVLSFEPISLATDMWSLGVLAYVLLTGYSPFGGDTKQETYCNITRCKLDFPPELFEDVSDTAKEFISSLLVKNPTDRPTASQCLKHPWLHCTEDLNCNDIVKQEVSSTAVEEPHVEETKVEKVPPEETPCTVLEERVAIAEPSVDNSQDDQCCEVKEPVEEPKVETPSVTVTPEKEATPIRHVKPLFSRTFAATGSRRIYGAAHQLSSTPLSSRGVSGSGAWGRPIHLVLPPNKNYLFTVATTTAPSSSASSDSSNDAVSDMSVDSSSDRSSIISIDDSVDLTQQRRYSTDASSYSSEWSLFSGSSSASSTSASSTSAYWSRRGCVGSLDRLNNRWEKECDGTFARAYEKFSSMSPGNPVRETLRAYTGRSKVIANFKVAGGDMVVIQEFTQRKGSLTKQAEVHCQSVRSRIKKFEMHI